MRKESCQRDWTPAICSSCPLHLALAGGCGHAVPSALSPAHSPCLLQGTGLAQMMSGFLCFGKLTSLRLTMGISPRP